MSGTLLPSAFHRTATRLVDRLTRASSTPSSPRRAFSTAAMQAPQWTPGTERSVWRVPSPRSRLDSRISSGAIGEGGSNSSLASAGAQQVIASAHRLVGVPSGVAEQREDDDQAEEAGHRADGEQEEHDGAPY